MLKEMDQGPRIQIRVIHLDEIKQNLIIIGSKNMPSYYLQPQNNCQF